jgi:hypothetical protein
MFKLLSMSARCNAVDFNTYFEHNDTGTFTNDKAISIPIEGSAGLGRAIIELCCQAPCPCKA